MINAGKVTADSNRLDLPKPVSTKSESRLDPLTGNWTIFSPHRDERPDEFEDQEEVSTKSLDCPFCPGNETKTPEPVWIGQASEDDSSIDVLSPAHFDSPTEDWSVRVVPNKYPAVDPVDANEVAHRESALFQRSSVRGGHEVIVESRNHVQSLSELDVAELHLVFQALRDRIRYWRDVPRVSYITAFKNVGAKAGASLRHTHSQLIAMDRMPPAVSTTIDRMVRHHAVSGCCLQCDLIRGELKSGQRIIWCDDSLVAFCPFASQLPMLLRITSLEHQPCYEDLSDTLIESVSRLVGRAVSWLEQLRPGTAYNFCLRTLPPGTRNHSDSFHWSMEIFPRMTQVAGFEWSSQCMINPVLPELAAAKFRSRVRAEDPRIML